MENEKGLSFQRTIHNPFTFEGIGLHTGKKCTVKVSPLPVDSGVRFYRTDLKAEILLSPNQVSSTVRGTVLSGEKNAVIHTVEHFLASVHGLQLNNLKVEMNSEEMPILDGSAVQFCVLFQKAGIVEQGKPINPIRLTETIEMKFGDIYLKAEPADGLTLEVTTSFPYPGLGEQKKTFQLKGRNFEQELAPARTFCFEDEIEALRQQGLIKGGDLNCALVIGKKGVLNGPFRFEDE
ncbi:MAG TPA: UDP-3-O-acyl-N-acetylglucosamine deacetylase, partial [bacterium]